MCQISWHLLSVTRIKWNKEGRKNHWQRALKWMQHREKKFQNNRARDLAVCRLRFESCLWWEIIPGFLQEDVPELDHSCEKQLLGGLIPLWQRAALACSSGNPVVPPERSQTCPAGWWLVLALSWGEAEIETNPSSAGELLLPGNVRLNGLKRRVKKLNLYPFNFHFILTKRIDVYLIQTQFFTMLWHQSF